MVMAWIVNLERSGGPFYVNLTYTISSNVSLIKSIRNLRRTNGLAELAGDTSLFTGRIAPQRVLASKSRTQWSFFKRIIDGRRFLQVKKWPTSVRVDARAYVLVTVLGV